MNSGARTSGTEYQILYGFIIMSYNRLSLMVISRFGCKIVLLIWRQFSRYSGNFSFLDHRIWCVNCMPFSFWTVPKNVDNMLKRLYLLCTFSGAFFSCILLGQSYNCLLAGFNNAFNVNVYFKYLERKFLQFSSRITSF